MAEHPAQESADLATLDTDINLLATDQRPLGDICAGCAELTERIERLERRLSQLDSPPAQAALGTTLCYWLCVGFHALLCFGSFGSDNTASFAYIFVIGGCGTLAVCHVLSTRTFIAKTARSALSLAIVTSTIGLTMWLTDQNDLEDLFQVTALYLPVLVFAGWIVAKSFVWTRGWRIIPPGGSKQFSKPSIRDLMMITVVAAILFGAFRFTIGDVADDLADEWMAFLIYIAAPVGTASLITVFLARVILSPREWVSIGQLILAIFAAIGSVILLYAMLLGLDGVDGDFSDLTTLLIYCATSAGLGMISPLVTFALMRSAGYRFAGRA